MSLFSPTVCMGFHFFNFSLNGELHVLGYRTPQIGEPHFAALRPNYVVLTRPTLASEFGFYGRSLGKSYRRLTLDSRNAT
ncbi:hypothetical protein Hanom_Chr09g00806551 [Helianthus anomalus]